MAINVGADFQTILTERGQILTLRKQTITTGSSGEVTNVSNTDSSVTGILLRLADKDRALIEQGIAKRGDIKGFFKPIDNVDVDDIIIDGTDQWRVVHTLRRIFDGTEAFRKAILRRIA